jgi:hypothetical protein
MAEVAYELTARPKDPAWKFRLGKFMFYVTCALGIWFFYWFAAIQCPC